MHLIVGLGNPGSKYLMNRHNIGFMVIDAIANELNAPATKKEKKSETTKVNWQGASILLAKPQTYMNLSGEAVQPLMSYYNLELHQLLVIHDDIDLPFGTIKIQKDRGPGGQNGIKSIHEQLGTKNYARLKMGVGRPSNPKQDVASYVLQNFSGEDLSDLSDFIALGANAALSFASEGFEKSATKYSGKSIFNEID